MTHCPLCNSPTDVYTINDFGREFSCSCSLCGEYVITEAARNRLNGEEYIRHKPKVSAFLKQRQINKLPAVKILLEKGPEVTDEQTITVDAIINAFPKSMLDRVNNVLFNLSKLSEFMGSYIDISGDSSGIFFADSYDHKATFFMMKFLFDEKYIEKDNGENVPNFPAKIRLTPKGWERVLQLESGNRHI